MSFHNRAGLEGACMSATDLNPGQVSMHSARWVYLPDPGRHRHGPRPPRPPQPSSHHGNSLTLKLKLACTKKDQGKERKYNYLQELINPPPCCCCRILLLGCLDAPRHGSSWHLDIPVVSDCTSFSRIRFPSVPFVINDDQPSPPAHRWHSWR